MKKTILLIILCFANIANSQSNPSRKNFSVVISSGTSLNDPIAYYFYGQTEAKYINPGYAGSAALEYGPFDIVELTQLFLSLSVGYTKVSTTEYEINDYRSTAKLSIETFPILLWWRVQTNTTLSPFVEVGIGISKLNFIEQYSSKRINSTSFNYWALGYGFGAGLNYKISNNIEIALVLQRLAIEKEKILKNNPDYESGIWVRNIVSPISLRFKLIL